MQTRRLGDTDLELTTIGFGAWAIGGTWEWGWGAQDDAESVAAIRRALELGVNWIDTAAAYGVGHSEEVVARALAGRDDVIVATKCGQIPDPAGGGRTVNRLDRKSVRGACEDSLRRLRVEAIDLYQIHWPIPDEDVEEGWAEIARLVEEGKVRHAGVSNFNVAQLERIRPIHPIASLQPPYSLLDRGVEDELLGYCAGHGIGVVAYSPMASGLLTGKYTHERVASLAPDDWRRRSSQFQEPELSANVELVEGLRALAERHGRSVGELAITWVLRRAEVTSAIVGARRPDQIEQTAAAADWSLSEAELAEIDELLSRRERAVAA